jgi:phosphoserine phosphatase
MGSFFKEVKMTEKSTQLTPSGWNPEVYDALIKLINTHGINSEGYNPDQPPLVALDCDGTLILNDVGEALMRFLVNRRQINGDRRFWQSLMPENLGRDALSAAFKAVAGRGDSEVYETAAYRRFRAGMFGAYETLKRTEGQEAAYIFAARLVRGLHEKTVAEIADEVVQYELSRPLSVEDIPFGPPFRGLSLTTGIAVFPEMLELIDVLHLYGFSVWIVSASLSSAVKALGRQIDFPEDKILGIELETMGGRYTEVLEDPSPIGEGKRELFLDTVGRSPVLVMGDSMGDFALLENCEGLSIVIDRGETELLEKAKENDWLVQPQFQV